MPSSVYASPKKRCIVCNFSNFTPFDRCLRCYHGSDLEGAAAQSNEPQSKRSHLPIAMNNSGLATSRWAPRNMDGSHGQKQQIWTYVGHQNPEPIGAPTTTAKLPDLGLPYQVQHYILATIQRILEEACFDFASRWIPSALHQNNWDCPEAVELSKWRDFLPGALPPAYYSTISFEHLSAALVDAVRIRNKATHRHLCDNVEMKHMATQAQRLMSMFADATRQYKFIALRTELGNWDVNSRGDAQGARMKLENALRDIGERPLDDMDWTPNAVSLQEVTENPGIEDDQYADEMDLD